MKQRLWLVRLWIRSYQLVEADSGRDVTEKSYVSAARALAEGVRVASEAHGCYVRQIVRLDNIIDEDERDGGGPFDVMALLLDQA